MPELVTLGETMVLFTPPSALPLRYVDSFHRSHAGAESNTAIGVFRLGHSSGWISRLGAEEFGAYLTLQIRGEGVDVSQVKTDPEAPTGLMFKELRQGRETAVTYYRRGSAASRMTPEDIDEGYIAGAKILHLTGITPALSESCRRTVLHAARLARRHGVLVSVDPNIRLKLWGPEEARPVLTELLREADIALMGLDEAELLFGLREPEAVFGRLFEMGVQTAALKAGAEGAWAAVPGERLRLPPVPAQRVDPIGAGDAFNAGFLCGLLEGKPLEACGRLGNAMGACAIQSVGDIESLPTRKELERFMAGTETAAR
ncbi:MAG: sugar kinase [Provencibacterium sp.]|jgi:2-dehydro-3-deoxygluconokinase|nr:sugar kinase [Provencibacterium sp.]